MKMTLIPFGESDYNELLLQAVAVLDQARSSLAIKISDTISNAHWNLGKLLTEKKLESKHGSAVVNRLSSDLKRRFPDMGVSPRNLWNMKRFYERYRNEDEKLLQAVAVLPWGHNLILPVKIYLPILFKYVFRFRKDKIYFTNLAIFANYCQN